ncbi:alpha-amylase family glycosyl hydrolase [Faecalibacter bovis]|uniref:Alpha-amylase n=1 Tax=Faecalibacter bovis TaxID=2898187 RepID=A0ABX7XGJ0_9FLAO|nr:alpha-amylase family glycosyl hydrolase [Faecalibacter bovis]MBS7332942.1 alpha-amylase [Weeksellaceae bacterium]QTV06983.1 alpha-amylase [Faecalibacter bovis]
MVKQFLALGLVAGLFITSCGKKDETNTEAVQTEQSGENIAPFTADMAETAVIYEVNVRQFSPEGTFAAVTKEIPNIKKLGVKVLWLMPIHPIGVEKRKEGLGSYYSISDYRGVNPEFGTAEDFRALVKEAHKNGIYVILDWVANHTAWDHPWMKSNPDFYEKDEKGNFISPYDWTDVVSLEYKNPALRKAMIADMKYWLDEFNIDGFRCDMAHMVPTDFWAEAKKELANGREIFMLGETEEPELLKNGVFDAAYGWELHHIMNDIAKGKKNVSAVDVYMDSIQHKWEKDDYKMLFTSNHDENSWAGTEFERMGDAVETFAALTYALPSVPLIYNGQEEDFNRRLKFFVKDSIDRNPNAKMRGVYEKLGELKITNEAFNGGKNAGSYERLKTSDDQAILAFKRKKNSTEAYFVGNFTKVAQEVIVPISGTFKNFMTGEEINLDGNSKVKFQPWQYYILVQK